MNLNDDFFGKVKKKTNVDKESLIDLAKLTGKSVSLEKEEKIINAIKQDKVPKNIDKFF